MSKDGGAGDFLRTRVKPVVRRGVAKVEPLDRAASRLSARRAKIARLVNLYNVLRRNYLPNDDALPEGHLPGVEAVDRVEHAAWLAHHAYQSFFNTLSAEGDVERAMVAMTRRLISQNDRGRARIIAQVFQRYRDLRPVAEVCLGMCAIGEPMADEAWTYFNRHDLALVTQYMAGEYFRFAFGYNPGEATKQMQRVLAGEVPIEANGDVWYDIGFHSFAAGCEDIAKAALDRAVLATADMPDNRDTQRLKRRIAWLRGWLGRADAAANAAPAPAGEIPFALVGYSHPNRASISDNIGDSVQTLVTLGNVVRHDSVRFTGDQELARTATTLQAQTPKDRRVHHDAPSTVRLYEMNRDTSKYSAVPDGTWTVISDWFVHSLAGRHHDIPLNPKLRPVFVSFQITVNALKAPGAIEYLRRYAPIGCVDWDNVFLLHAAGIPAFFTGELGVTADVLFDSAKSAGKDGVLYVDVQGDVSGERLGQRSDDVYKRGLAGNIDAAAEFIRSLRDNDAKIVAGDLRTYTATRALRGNVEQRAADPFVPRSQDHTDVSDAEFTARQQNLSDKLSAVFTAILDGRSEDEVYATWREVCAPDVALVEKKLANVGPPPKLSFDLNVVCRTILERTVVVERTDTSPQGGELNIEFSLDANYKHQLDICLDSIVAHTDRPVRAFVLCRQHGQDDYDRMAKLFPSVSFVWLPTDNVDYGRISGMNKWVTPATMDRTVLPLLLPDVHRMLHFDLDALCMTDIAELYDVDMEGCGIASTPEPQPWYSSGFESYRRAANRLRREGTPDLARDLITRTHGKDHFDFLIFNAGIMVMDLDKMREDDFCGRYLAYVQVYGVNGQVVLNAYVGNNLKNVGADWNRLMRLEIVESPKIAHWAGPFKPWHKHVYVTGRELWLEGEARFAERAKRAGLVQAEAAPAK